MTNDPIYTTFERDRSWLDNETLGSDPSIHHIAKTITINFVAISRERLERRLKSIDETVHRFQLFFSRKVRRMFDLALQALDQQDFILAKEVLERKPDSKSLADKTVEYLGKRLIPHDPHRAVLYRLEAQMVELIQRMHSFANKIAKAILQEAEVEEQNSPQDVQIPDNG